MKETVLVTGGAGFIGSHLSEKLLNEGYSVRILDNLSFGKLENISKIAGDIEFIKGDLRNKSDVEKACKNVDFILHEGALHSVPMSMEIPMEFFEVNVVGTANLLEVAKNKGVKRIVFASSSSIYGKTKIFPSKESNKPNPVSPYALTKLVGEQQMKLYYNIFGLETICLRYFNVFGPKQDPCSQYSGVISIFAKKMLKNEKPAIFGNGLQSRDFTFVSNVAEANIKALKSGNKTCGETFNVCAGKTINLVELVEKLNKFLEKNIKPNFVPSRTGDVMKTMGSPEKAKKLLKFEIIEGFDKGLKKTVEWIENEKT